MSETLIYHITHIKNLESILQKGELIAKSKVSQHGVEHINIAHNSIQDKRATRIVPLPPGGYLHDYVPFYFAPRSPMLFSIHRGNVDGYLDDQCPILHIVTTTERIANAPLPFVFTDGHAIMHFSSFYTDLQKLDQIDWPLMCSTYWHDTEQEPDRKRRRQAEFLVYQRCDWSNIIGIGVINSEVQAQTQRILQQFGYSNPVKIHPEWYY